MSEKLKSSVLFLLIILLFISTLFGFFHNTYNLIKQDYTTRMLSIYGDCSKEGYGFTKYINDKYKSDFNYTVINGESNSYAITQDFFYKKENLFSRKFKILINYNDELLKNFKNFEILEKNNNCYFIKLLND
tara:strand:+ start:101 stop:496 length:396 start_codon:yes stop_codon:yes gene_type:complete